MLADEIIQYFMDKNALQSGWDQQAPVYYNFRLDEGFKNTQLVLALADRGYIVNLVHENESYSVYILKDSSHDHTRSQLDSFVRHFHTETAAHNRKLSNPSPAEKVATHVRPEIPSPLTTLSPQDSGLHRPVFDDDHEMTGQHLPREHIGIGQRDLDPLGKHPEMRPAQTGPGLPSQGGMHPTPWGSGARYDPPGPTSSFNNMP